MERTINNIKIELIRGDITKQPDAKAIVNAANAQLRTGGGVAGAIHRAAGKGLEEECEPLAPIEPGQAVITSGKELPNPHVIHCLGPVYGRDEPSDELLADCYRNSLRIADDKDLDVVAFPAISTGAFGYPLEEAARVALGTIIDLSSELSNVKIVRFVLFGQKDLDVHEKALEKLTQG